jgi:hypothetical protein
MLTHCQNEIHLQHYIGTKLFYSVISLQNLLYILLIFLLIEDKFYFKIIFF